MVSSFAASYGSPANPRDGGTSAPSPFLFSLAQYAFVARQQKSQWGTVHDLLLLGTRVKEGHGKQGPFFQ